MGHILRLQTGDKRSPTRQLLLSDGTSDGNIYIHTGGFSPGPGVISVQMSGRTIRADGQDRVSSSRDNIQMSILYDMRGDTYAELQYLQDQILQYFEEAKEYHERGVGEKVYLYYRWSTPAMDDIPIPTWGQFGYFFEVIVGEASWPSALHTGQLVSGNIESATLDLTCGPYPEGLDQWVFNADGIPDDDADVELTYDLSSNEFDGDFTLCGWIEHRESDYYVFEAYQDAADWINIFWDESDSRYELNSRVTSVTTTTNGSSQTLSAGDLVHVCLVGNNGGVDNWYVNGTAQTNGSSSQDWGSVEFTLASATSAGGVTGNANELDAWKLFDDALTADEVSGIYNQELPIKSQTRGNKLISPPVWLKTRSGDGVFENVDGVVSAAAKDNWGVLGGVPGHVEAKVKWEIDPGSTTPDRTFYLGRQAVQSTFTPNGVLWHDYSGTSDSGNSSGDAYEQIAGSDLVDFDATFNAAPISNQFQVFGRIEAPNGFVFRPYYQVGSAATNTKIKGDRVTASDMDDFYLVDFGRINCDWSQLQTNGAAKFGLTGKPNIRSFPRDDEMFVYWKLNEASGTRSASVGSYDLTDNGTTPNRTGKLTDAADFNGSSQYLNNTSSDFNFDGSFTITGWYLLDTKASLQFLGGKYNTTGDERSYLLFYSSSADRFRFEVSSDGTSGTVTTVSADNLGSVSTATWYFIVCAYNARTNTVSIQVNDNDVDTETHYGGIYGSTSDFTLGAGDSGVSYMNGGVDDVGIWERVLTSDEISNLYNDDAGLALETNGPMNLDFLHLLPDPSFKVEALKYGLSISATDKIVIEDRKVILIDTSNNQVYKFSYEGDNVTVLPEFYNYLFMLNGHLFRTYDISASNTLAAYVTPRYLLVGG